MKCLRTGAYKQTENDEGRGHDCKAGMTLAVRHGGCNVNIDICSFSILLAQQTRLNHVGRIMARSYLP